MSTLVEAAKIFGDAIHGDYSAQGRIKTLVRDGLSEALTTSDLARAFNVVTRQALEQQYAQLKIDWTDFAKRNTLPDFKPTYFREFIFEDDNEMAENGGRATAPGSLPAVPEGTEYPTFNFTTGKSQIQLHKNGVRIPFTWEMVINDEWNFIQSLPSRLAVYARNTEETEAVRALASATGPNAATFTGISAPGDAKLSIQALSDAQQEVINRQVNGRYVAVNNWRLVVPRSLSILAGQVLKTSQIEKVVTTASGQDRYTIDSPVIGNVQLTVSDWLTRIDKSANAATTWYLVPDGGTDGTRDSVLVNFLQGAETPEFRQSGGGGTYLGGGPVAGLEGSLLNDDIQYRVRHVVAGGVHHSEAMFASTGTV